MTEINAYMNGYQPNTDVQYLQAALEANKNALTESQLKVKRLEKYMEEIHKSTNDMHVKVLVEKAIAYEVGEVPEMEGFEDSPEEMEQCIVCEKWTKDYLPDEEGGTYWCEPCAKEESERHQLLERSNRFKFVPGHGPDINSMTNEQLEKHVNVMEKIFQDAFDKKSEKGTSL
jgi:hypothetical protein